MPPEDRSILEDIQLQDGASVLTADGKKVGSIQRVVIDPRSKKISNLVIRQGTVLISDKVVPVNLVESADKEHIILKNEAGDLSDLPEYKEAHYVAIDPNDITGIDTNAITMAPPRFYPYPPIGMTPTYYPVFVENYTVETEKHIPKDNLVIKEGAKVVSADDHNVGNIERVIADPDGGVVTHILISKGMLKKEHKLIPMDWIASIGEDDLHLAVDADLIERLAPYEE